VGDAACVRGLERGHGAQPGDAAVKAKRRVTTGPGPRPATKRTPTVRRIKPAIVPATSRSPAAPIGAGAARGAAATEPAPEPDDLDLTVDLGRGLVLANPLLAASGVFGYGAEYADVVDVTRLGAIVTRGTTLKARTGNLPPRVAETPGGLLSAVGLQNPGVDAVVERYAATWSTWTTPVFVNVAAGSVAEYVAVVRRLEGVSAVAGIELNLSCPNAARGGLLFALDAGAAGEVTAAVRRATDLPLLVKLSANVTDVRPIARAIEDAGADGLTAINTVAGLAVASSRAGPLHGATYGGLSGPAIKPIALRVVYEVSRAADIPVVAVGGVAELADVLDFLAVGAAAVQVGTAILADPTLPVRLVEELAAECRRRGLATHRDLVGTALPGRPGGASAHGVEYRP
jgi:dihydroorotate dehydrogenase (NAD+) catalytic subunit